MTFKRRRPILALLAAMAITFGAALFAAGPASAAQSTTAASSPSLAKTITYHSRTYTLRKTITPSGVATRSDAAASAAATPSCGLYVSPPIIIETNETFGPYSPFLVSVAGDAEVVCTIAVTSINMTASIAWDNIATLGTTVNSALTNTTPLAYAIDVCTSGDWAIGGAGTIVWPAAYDSPPSTFAGFRPDYAIGVTTCDD